MVTNFPIKDRGVFFLSLMAVVWLLLNSLIYLVIWTESSRDELTVTFLDVGQGDATLVEAPNGNRVLIDAGGGRRVLESLSEQLPFYDRRIDVVIATHPHADHIGGLVDVLEHFEVGVVLDSGVEYDSQVYTELQNVLADSSTEKLYARRGMIIRLGPETLVPVLFPTHNTREMDADAASIWIHLIHGQTRFLFTGDAFSSIEGYMVRLEGERLASEVFQAGHHGSNTSNSLELLSIVRPEYVVVSAGRDNRYGHPHPEPMEHFEALGVEVLKTFNLGDVTMTSDGEEVKLK